MDQGRSGRNLIDFGYLDSSFVVKLYVSEAESGEAARIMTSLRGRAAISRLTDVEVAAALYRNADPHLGEQGYRMYRHDRAARVYREFEFNDAIFQRGEEIAEQYAMRYKLRSLDILQLATATYHGLKTVATFDHRMIEAGAALGLRILPGSS